MSAGNNPRINLKNLIVVDRVIMKDKQLQEQIENRFKQPVLRTKEIVLSNQDYGIMLLDIKKSVRLSNNTKEPYLYLFADGVLVAIFVSVSLWDAKEKAEKDDAAQLVKAKASSKSASL